MDTSLHTPTGRLTQPVRIEAVVLTPDGQGGNVQSWATRADPVWALVEPLSSREALLAKALTAVLMTALTMRFLADLDITDRVLIRAPGASAYYDTTGKLVPKTRVLRLQSFQDPTGRRAELRVLCAETQA